LVIGGVTAAPLAAYLCKKAPVQALLTIVGTILIILNIYALYRVF